MTKGHREELGFTPCEAPMKLTTFPGGVVRDSKGRFASWNKVYVCGKPAKLYGEGEECIALCSEHKHLALRGK